MTVLPRTVKPAEPLTLVICVPGGNWSVEAKDATCRSGSVTGAPKPSL